MPFFQIAILAVVQGLAELLPISSSAHVIVAERILGLDPTTPEMTLLLVMLHTGTMLAVLVYFWGDWKRNYFQTSFRGWAFTKQVVLATAATGVVGGALMLLIEKVLMAGTEHAEVEALFGNLKLMAVGLTCAGLVILLAASREKFVDNDQPLGPIESICIGLIQGLCLPIRGFSRSGATISTGILLKLPKFKAEEFSFALALVITPPILVREVHRLLKARAAAPTGSLSSVLLPDLLGMALSFGAGLLALHWLSSWLARGHWKFFGLYCLAFAGVVWFLS
jgi:undecaprenyl-diphosphatase